jgi:nucleoside phosphorylase
MAPSGMLPHDQYTVACICPMGVELAPVLAILDETHGNAASRSDQNSYTLGRIGPHNVVVAVMPETGNNQAAVVATQLLNDFCSIRFGLLVGVGGGVPGKDDIRLGDVVVSKPTQIFGGVVQYDRGKSTTGGLFERTGILKKPPPVLSANVQKLHARQFLEGNQIVRYLEEMVEKYPNLAKSQYIHPGAEHDQLFQADYHHQGLGDCQACDKSQVVDRARRPSTDPETHYGTIGSGNAVIKDGRLREQLRENFGVLCVDMEAAGLMDDFSCLVIRGICDYADSHKNKRWQPYAAATAAAYMKALLCTIPAPEVVETPTQRSRE